MSLHHILLFTRDFERDNCVTNEILQSDCPSKRILQCHENQLKIPDRFLTGVVWGQDYSLPV